MAAGLDPVGKARRVPGGVIYSGRHGFSSGIDHVRWLICGGHIFDEGKPPQRCFFLVPKSEATVIDDWYVMGLAGTGSKSFEINERFVPDHRIIDALAADDSRGPGVAVNSAPIFRVPFTIVAATGFAAIAVGIAQGFLAEWTAYTRGRSRAACAVAALRGTQIDRATPRSRSTPRTHLSRRGAGCDGDPRPRGTAQRDAASAIAPLRDWRDNWRSTRCSGSTTPRAAASAIPRTCCSAGSATSRWRRRTSRSNGT